MKRLPDVFSQIEEIADLFDVINTHGGTIVSPKSLTSRQKQIAQLKAAAKKKKKAKPKVPRKRVLCKIKVLEDYDFEDSDVETLIVYTDNTARWSQRSADELSSYWVWKLAHSDVGPMLMVRETDYDGNFYWECQYSSQEKRDIVMAEGIAKALADLEMEKLLKGDFDTKEKEDGTAE